MALVKGQSGFMPAGFMLAGLVSGIAAMRYRLRRCRSASGRLLVG
jgi:hypothetical protein